jgi:hypothetical protein
MNLAHRIGMILSAIFLLNAFPSQAGERLFLKADIAAGKALHSENNCSACHKQASNLEEHGFYTRSNRKVTSQEKLLTQIGLCSAKLNLSFFPDDELNIAAFLNETYYKLK